MKNFLSYVLLGLYCAGSLVADVTYEETYRTVSFQDRGPRARVEGVEPAVFDMPAALYSPSFEHAKGNTIRVYIKGAKMGRIGSETSEIYDLDAQTLTTIFHKTHRYTVVPMDKVKQARFGNRDGETYTAVVQKTGETKTVDGGQTAEKYLILGIGHLHGRNRVAGTAIYWLVGQNSPAESTAFQAKWAERCKLPYPSADGLVGVGMPVTDAMEAAARGLEGRLLVASVVEIRPSVEIERMSRMNGDRSGNGFAADEQKITPGVAPTTQVISVLDEIYATQAEASGFSTAAVDDEVFAVPAGYKRK